MAAPYTIDACLNVSKIVDGSRRQHRIFGTVNALVFAIKFCYPFAMCWAALIGRKTFGGKTAFTALSFFITSTRNSVTLFPSQVYQLIRVVSHMRSTISTRTVSTTCHLSRATPKLSIFQHRIARLCEQSSFVIICHQRLGGDSLRARIRDTKCHVLSGIRWCFVRFSTSSPEQLTSFCVTSSAFWWRRCRW